MTIQIKKLTKQLMQPKIHIMARGTSQTLKSDTNWKSAAEGRIENFYTW